MKTDTLIPNKDRNFHLGGRSFYFFDFDDNLVFLTTPAVLFHKSNGDELLIESSEYVREQSRIGQDGKFADYEIRWDNDQFGTFRFYRDHSPEGLAQLGRKRQVLIEDIAHILGYPAFEWRGPSWERFRSAIFNERFISLITARGNAPETIVAAIELFVEAGHLSKSPHYLSVLPVHHEPTKLKLGDAECKLSTPELKRRAIKHSVEEAFARFGTNPHHRFGMSDDDPANVEMIVEEMKLLKQIYPENGFFLFQTTDRRSVRYEVKTHGVEQEEMSASDTSQFLLFQDSI